MAKTRLKSGEFAMELEQDPPLWTDRKRILGLPISFTRYTLTARKLLLNTGLLNLREEEVLLYRVRDVSLSQSLLDRLFGVGTLCVDSSDLSVPHLHLRHVKNPDKVKAALSQCVEQARRKNRIRSTELMGVPDEGEDGLPDDLDGDGVLDNPGDEDADVAGD